MSLSTLRAASLESAFGGIFLPFSAFALTSLSMLLYTSWRRLVAYRYRNRKRIKNNADVGRFIGMDLGGTLAKIVYFETYSDPPGAGVGLAGGRSSSNGCGDGDGDEDSSPISLHPPASKSKSIPDKLKEEEANALKDLHRLMSIPVRQVDADLTIYSSIFNGKINFVTDETKNVSLAIKNLKDMDIINNIKTIGCTGGGALKYEAELKTELDVDIKRVDEFDSLIKGMNAVLTELYTDGECYTFLSSESDRSDPDTKQFSEKQSVNFDINKNDVYPYLVVNIGSGVSILKVKGPNLEDFERVSGSSLGGGTYWGLCRLITGNSDASFEEVLKLAEQGNTQEVDLSVKDIYGGHIFNKSNVISLNEKTVASSFGKLQKKVNPRDGVSDSDLAKALLMMITNNIGQLAYMNAKFHNCKSIFFIGNFLRHNDISCHKLSYALDFWSNHEMKALFLRHEGYLGALGTFLINAELFLKESNRSAVNFGVARDGSFEENTNSSFLNYVRETAFRRIRHNFKRLFRSRGVKDVKSEVAPGEESVHNKSSLVRSGSAVRLQQYDSDDEISMLRQSNISRRRGLGLSVSDELAGATHPRGRNNTFDEEELMKARVGSSASATSSPIGASYNGNYGGPSVVGGRDSTRDSSHGGKSSGFSGGISNQTKLNM